MLLVEDLDFRFGGESPTSPLLQDLRPSILTTCSRLREKSYRVHAFLDDFIARWYDLIDKGYLSRCRVRFFDRVYGDHSGILEIAAVGINAEGEGCHVLPLLR